MPGGTVVQGERHLLSQLCAIGLEILSQNSKVPVLEVIHQPNNGLTQEPQHRVKKDLDRPGFRSRLGSAVREPTGPCVQTSFHAMASASRAKRRRQVTEPVGGNCSKIDCRIIHKSSIHDR